MIIRGINGFFSRHSRWIFGIFTVVIIISFMGIMTPGQYSGCFGGSQYNVGTIFGKKINLEDLQEVTRETQILYFTLLGFEPRETNYEQAFFNLAQRQAAKERGLVVSDKEVADFIQTIPRFVVNGAFSDVAYTNYIKNITSSNIDENTLVEAIRNYILMQKLYSEIQASVIVTDNEVENFYKIYNEKINVKRAEFLADNFKSKIEISNEALKAFFEANRNKYMVDANSKLLLATFEFDDPAIIAEANKLMTQDALKKYYENNKATFTVTNEKGSTVTPFESAIEQVKINFRAAKAKELAINKAQVFARDVYEAASEDTANSNKIFNQQAQSNKAKLVEVAKISAKDTKAGSVESPALIKEVFTNTLEVPITNAVIADKGVYVGYIFDFVPTRQAEFSEVAKQVYEDYKADLAYTAAITEANKVYNELKALDNVAMSAKINSLGEFKSIKDLSLTTPPKDLVTSSTLGTAKNLKTKDLSNVVSIPGGAMLIYVESRTFPTLVDFEKDKEQTTARYRELKTQSAMAEFESYLSKQCVMSAKL